MTSLKQDLSKCHETQEITNKELQVLKTFEETRKQSEKNTIIEKQTATTSQNKLNILSEKEDIIGNEVLSGTDFFSQEVCTENNSIQIDSESISAQQVFFWNYF